MQDPAFFSSSSQPIFVIHLHGHKSNPMIPAKFFSTHIEGKNKPMELKLTSDASDRTWEVKLDGRRFAQGWEDLSAVHSLQDDDVLIFRDNGNMTFHVIASGRSLYEVQCISSEEDEDDTRAYSRNFASKQKPRTEAESSSENSYLVARVTTSNLSRDTLWLMRSFARSNSLNERCCEIDLMNQNGKSWTLGLRYNKTNDRTCIRGGWRDFCLENGLQTGSFYRFKFARNGSRPLLRLCCFTVPEANGQDSLLERSSTDSLESASMKQNKFLTVTFKPYMLKSGQLRLPRHFVIENGITRAREIILVDRNGGKWPSDLVSANDQGGYYVGKGWKSFCEANRLKAGETFTFEFVRVEGTTPMLYFKSKVKNKHHHMNRFQKKARISAEGPSRCTIASNKKPLQTSSISDQVADVKQSIADTLTGVRRFRSELQIKEQNLEASLQEINALGLI